jgi:hypothetical protein
MVRTITLRPRKGTRRHDEHAREFLAVVAVTQHNRTRLQRLALYEERACQRLPLFDE